MDQNTMEERTRILEDEDIFQTRYEPEPETIIEDKKLD